MASRTTALRTALQRSRPVSHTPNSSFIRRYASSTTSQHHVVPPSEQDKSRHDIVVDSQENTKTGYDGWAAETSETAFTRQRLDPEEQRQQAEEESKRKGQGANPLDVSAANSEVSQVRDALKEGLETDATITKKVSKGGSPLKNSPGKKYEKESELRQQGSNRGIQ